MHDCSVFFRDYPLAELSCPAVNVIISGRASTENTDQIGLIWDVSVQS